MDFLKDDEQSPQNQDFAPKGAEGLQSGGGAAPEATDSGGAPSGTPASNPATSPGAGAGGFANLSAFLNANKSGGQQLAGSVQNQLKGQLDQAVNGAVAGQSIADAGKDAVGGGRTYQNADEAGRAAGQAAQGRAAGAWAQVDDLLNNANDPNKSQAVLQKMNPGLTQGESAYDNLLFRANGGQQGLGVQRDQYGNDINQGVADAQNYAKTHYTQTPAQVVPTPAPTPAPVAQKKPRTVDDDFMNDHIFRSQNPGQG